MKITRTLAALLATLATFAAMTASHWAAPAAGSRIAHAAQPQANATLGWANEKMPPGMRKGEQSNEYVWEKDGSVMVYVPAGEFSMGRDWAIAHEKPVHTVRLSAFYIDKYEVKRGAFRKFVSGSNYKTTAEQKGTGKIVRPTGVEEAKGKSWRDPGFEQDDSHPAVLVSWDDAKAYAAWAGKSLPTEAQWEKAATWDAAAPPEKRKRLHPWGNNAAAGRDAGTANIVLVGNFADVSFGELVPPGGHRDYLLHPEFGGQYNDDYVYTAPTGRFLRGRSPYGVLDMAGNVMEWCEDGYAADYYSRSPAVDPVNSDGRNGRIIRGSGYDEPSTTPKPSAFRNYLPAHESYTTIGFRCVVRAP